MDSEQKKRQLLAQLESLLAQRLSEPRAALAIALLQPYFRRVPMEEMTRLSADNLAGMVESLVKFAHRRQPGETLLRVYNPVRRRHGWDCEHTVIEMVNDDKPFLVDSAAVALAELGLDLHLIIHPVLRVRRDGRHRLTAITGREDPHSTAESVMHFQVRRQTAPELLQRIEDQLLAALNDVNRAVADWKAMLTVTRTTIDEMPARATRADAGLIRECQEFLKWLLDDHFIFLGIRDYAVVRGSEGHELRVVPGTGLGILREDGTTVRSRPLGTLAEEARKTSHDTPLIITKTNSRSTVHRLGYFDYIGVLQFDARGRTVAERRFLGLFTSSAYNRGVLETPLLRGRVQQVLDQSGLHPGSHAWKSLLHILQTLPRDDLFQANAAELSGIATGILNLQERSRVRLFIRRERYGRFYSCLVFIPRDRFNTENRERIQAILKRALKGRRLDFSVHIAESALARLQVIVRPEPGSEIVYDVDLLEQKIVDAVRSWTDELTSILTHKHGEEAGRALAERFATAFPEAYKEDVSPWVAAFDIDNLAAVDAGQDLRMGLYRPRKPRGGIVRFKLFKKDRPIPLSHVLPMLENLGLHIVSERPYQLRMGGEESIWIQDFDMIPDVEHELDLDAIRDLFQEAFARALSGQTDSDGFNRLVIAAEMHWRQVKILRAYCKYLLQVGTPFSQAYMAETLAKFPLIARLLIELFEAMFDPARESESDFRREQAAKAMARLFDVLTTGPFARDAVLREYLEEVVQARAGRSRDAQSDSVRTAFQRALSSVSILDEDRILYAFYDVIRATLRTSFFRTDGAGSDPEYISFKLDSARVTDLPLPRPYREIWVYSPRFEGIHLRGGRIARGGLRWSDRREDFRTEVLGLMKAQNVKNTMIVPVGAKGGFVLKRPPAQGGREAIQKEGIACYSQFINALLDLTDNLDEGRVLHPENVVRRDEDDTYLVVAADKGTASFSDIANGISLERGFWLADAFASGGSVGYDHKGMGITAKGAWESVKRHFRELGLDIQKKPFTVVGIGDMSGDVFGNGMLLSRHIQLRGAFNHLHIFLDPSPDPKTSLAERRRLFRKPRSGWADYRSELISRGGGVYSRADKTIALSPEVRAWLGTDAEALPPHEVIKLLLTAPVDLLWNGGIGTYVKASTEANAEVGDIANNALRVNGKDLRCRVVGEGGNLGFTQRGRIEFAQKGGRINTDFIDNSAGVNTSDHEVNIKILLAQAMRAGELDARERVRLLASMSDEVERLVLRSNYLQSQALSMMETLTGPRVGSKQQFIAVLESQGVLNRKLEALPDDEELTSRRNHGGGLARPELAVLLSYSKIVLYQQLLASDLPDDPHVQAELVRYFPEPLQRRFAHLMPAHRLRREIIATQVTNSVVNRMGASFALRMHEDTGAPPAAVAKAYTVAREVLSGRDFWAAIEALDNQVPAAMQTRALMAMWNLLRQATRWVLIRCGSELDVKSAVERLAPRMRVLEERLGEGLDPGERERLDAQIAAYVDAGFPVPLAQRIALLSRIFPALDVAETAAQRHMDVREVAGVYFGLSELLSIRWLGEQLESLPVKGQWHAHARALLRDEFYAEQNRLVESVLAFAGDGHDPLPAWQAAHASEIAGYGRMMNSMRDVSPMDYATLSVAVRGLGQLVDTAAGAK